MWLESTLRIILKKSREDIIMAKMPKFEMKIKFVPKLVIFIGDEKLGELTFKGAKDMGKFIDGLRISIKNLIKKFEAREHPEVSQKEQVK